jgi:hypothetical protein
MGVRPARVTDGEGMFDLAELKRRDYAENAAYPFQRSAVGAREAQGPFFHHLLSAPASVMLVHLSGGAIDGLLTGKVGATPPPLDRDSFRVDDFALASVQLWPSTGRATRAAAASEFACGRLAVAGARGRRRPSRSRCRSP